jgi:hypothetical protein
MKVLWQHRDGNLYAVEHDTFGHVTGAAGPLDWDQRGDTDECRCTTDAIDWVEDAIRRHALHRVPQAVLQ